VLARINLEVRAVQLDELFPAAALERASALGAAD
jgi:hypothetical protein